MWILSRFFTVTTNLAVAMTWIATGQRLPPLVLGGMTLSLLLVGIVYGLLLRGLHPLPGPALTANILLHDVSPAMMVAWWLLFAPRSRLKWGAPWLWSLYPLAYVGFVLPRARIDARYPYPFMDLPRIGRVQTAMNPGGIALGFLIVGFFIVWIGSCRPLGSKRANG